MTGEMVSFSRMRGGHRRYLLAFCALVAVSATGCLPSRAQAPDRVDIGDFDASKLPRLPGAKDVFASPFTTIFVSPQAIGPTADAVEKALVALGWQKYAAPNTASAENPTMRTLTLKKGRQALNVFITVAPAQNNAISVQYSAVPLKVDLPFTADAADIEYSPDRPSLSLVSGEPVEKLLDFYRQELASRGWVLWSAKANGKQAPGGPSGTFHERGGFAYFVSDQEPKATLALVLQKTDAGKVRVEIKPQPISVLANERQVYLGRDNVAPPVAVSDLPRLPGARDTGKSTAERVSYSVPGNVPATTSAIKALLAAQGWTFYLVPLDDRHSTWLTFIKGQQGLSVRFTISPGRNEENTDQTTVEYMADRLQFAPPVAEDAVEVMFDEHRPYLSLISGGTPQSLREFYARTLAASDWELLPEADIATKWPNAKLDPKPANGDIAYFMRGNVRPLMLVLRTTGQGRTQVELKAPAFAELQSLEADNDIFGLPVPKPRKNAGGTNGGTGREIHAQVMASLEAVLSFYRGALSARGWKEDARAMVGPEDAEVNFTFPEGTASLKLARQYGLTTVSLIEKITKPKPQSVAGSASVNDMLQQAQQMMRDAEAQAGVPIQPPAAARGADDAVQPLQPLAGGNAPIPLPETAQDIDFDGEDGTLQFASASSVKSIAEFFRSALQRSGWRAKPSVINNANMAQLQFAKGNKDLSITVMKMGPSTNVNARGSGLQVAAAKPDAPAAGNRSAGSAPTPAPSADDLIVEESAGLPVPKRHTMSEGTQTPFRRELNANVPLDLSVVLEFYRRELGTRNWKEDAKSVVVAADRATVRFASPDGPAVLKLSRKGNETTVNLAVKNPEAARKAGILPPAGKAHVMFGNIMPEDASLTFNNRTIKVAANAGTKGPDGPALDLAPGKYKYSIKTGGKIDADEVEIRSDETWGLMIGPGGVLALQAY
ncbi:hypothetical protein [Xanthobacter versatilis]|uniref:hypothetical protein n=1 Tax=Xanthobacter autotrophicus (strain ATCC BAA-1158 / Py2) TaxID=78245 RepID=UPI0037294C3D